ncbi:MAG: tail fiber domain-containing protein [Pirellulales bacterium]|nr:tail fiber domain-containing protein [Pirellulales bacterium]
MKKIYLSFILFSFIAISVLSQTPQAIKYQAIARDAVGNIIADQDVALRISILEASAIGTAVYVETHIAHTNQFGLLNIEIGNGTPVSGNFSTIGWGSNIFFVKTEMDPSGGSAYVFMGTSQLLSVPYSLFSENTANVDDADADPANELQTLSKTGSTVELSNGGGTVNDDVDDADNNPANELQILSKTGSTIELSNGGGSVTDNVDDADNNPANELQTISKSGSTVTLSDGGGSFTDAVNDGDISSTNELQNLSLSGNNLTISNGNTIGLPAGLPTGSLGKTLYHNGSSWLASTNLYNDGGNIGIGTITPTNRLHIYNSVNDGDVTIEDNFPFLTFDATSTSGNSGLTFKTMGSYTGWIEHKATENAIYISAANSPTAQPHIVVKSNGMIGINTSAPAYQLSVNGAMGINDYIIHNGDSDTRIFLLPDGIEFTVGNEELIDLSEGIQDFVKLGDGGDVDINLNDDLFIEGSSGNVGIGTITPTDRLHIYNSANDGDVTIEDNFPFLTFDATSASGNAGLIFKELGSYKGWITYKNAADALYISAANSSTAASHIVVETGGDVGIGTSNPDRKLTVNGTVGINDYLVHNGDADTKIYMLTDGMEFTVGNEKLIDLSEGAQDVVKLGDGGDVDINLNDDLFVQGSNGYVGIGTSTPTSKLTFGGAGDDIGFNAGVGSYINWYESSTQKAYFGYSGTNFHMENNETGGYIMIDAQDKLYLNTNDITRLTIDNTGNVGIGITTPTKKLHVRQNNTLSGTGVIQSEYTGTTLTDAVAVFGEATPTGGYGVGGKFYGGYRAVWAIAEPVTYSSSTYAVYGTNSGANAGAKYGVRGYAWGASGNTGTIYGVYGYGGGTGTTKYAGYFSGNLKYTGTLSGPSDRKLKTNIQPLNSALNKVNDIKVYSYNFKEVEGMELPEGKNFGFIAQELELVYPELVTQDVHTIENEDKTTKTIEYKGISYIGMIPILTKSIQEQQLIIDSLQKQIDKLNKQMEELKK